MGGRESGTITNRERDCLALVARGNSSKEIAVELGISHHTVDLHLKRAIKTLGASSRREAARLASAGEHRPNQLLDTQPAALADTPAARATSQPDRLERPAFPRLPFLRQGKRLNDLRPLARLAWIAALSLAILLAAANFLNGLGALWTLAG